ncbi:hypothetical protein BDB01DRAFT_802651 [Pilobolus umbonatus]|nr:hypothetical protein BDB01DRAFT_802651 [Pilobolus umbonatus]
MGRSSHIYTIPHFSRSREQNIILGSTYHCCKLDQNRDGQKLAFNTTHLPAHSIRSASGTKDVELGHSIQEVKPYTNWSLNANTFEK